MLKGLTIPKDLQKNALDGSRSWKMKLCKLNKAKTG